MKKFIIRTLLICSPVIALYAYPMLKYANGEAFGDLSQLGNYFFNKEYLPVMSYNPGFNRHVILTTDVTEEVCDSDVMVIGDSFTQIGYPNFMEYLQSMLPNRSVYNVHTYQHNHEWHYVHKSLEGSGCLLAFPGKTDLVLYLLNYAKRLPSTIVIESSEMKLMETITKTNFDVCEDSLENFDGPLPASSQEKYAEYSRLLIKPDPVKCLLDGRAINFSHDWIKRRIGTVKNPVSVSALSKPMFSCKAFEKTLYYVPYNMKWTKEDVKKMRSMMAQIIDKGAKRNVNIIFMVVPLKQHAYSDLMLKVPANEHLLSDSLADLQNDSHYLLCHSVLRPHIEQNEPDIFLANDSHWSWKGAKYCAEALKQKIEDR